METSQLISIRLKTGVSSAQIRLQVGECPTRGTFSLVSCNLLPKQPVGRHSPVESIMSMGSCHLRQYKRRSRMALVGSRGRPSHARGERVALEFENVERISTPSFHRGLRGGRHSRFRVHDFSDSRMVCDPPEAVVHSPELILRTCVALAVLPNGNHAIPAMGKETTG